MTSCLDPDACRAPSPGTSLRGRSLLCGKQTHRRLARLLGVDREPVLYAVASASWVEDHIEIELVSVDGEVRIDLVLEATRTERAFLAGPEVGLWVRQSQIPPALSARLLERTARLLNKLPLADLERMVVLDPDVVEKLPARSIDPAQETAPLEGISIPTSAVFACTAPEFYADFFAAPEIRRAGCDIVDVHSAHTLVSHGDVECSYCAVCIPRPRTALVRLPVYETVRNIGRPPAQHGAFDESEDPATAFCSDMTEQDIIQGAPCRLTQVLAHADHNRTRDSLLVIGLCLPDVIGEDQEGAVRDFAQTTTTPVFSVPASPRSWGWLATDLLRTRRKALSDDQAPDSRAINLIGFSRNAGTRELTALLASVGISVQTLVLPDLHLGAVARIPKATLNVYLPNVHFDKFYAHLQDDAGRRHLVLDGPYGMQGTWRWLEQVSAALGVQCDVVAPGLERFAAMQARWDSLRREASGRRLGLVVASHELETLLGARFSWGIALTDVLREMGFAMDLFIGGPRAEEAARSLRARIKLQDQDYSLSVFSSLASLLDALRSSACQAVFSNYMFDWRLVQTGKTPFSTLEFEIGYAGAIATLERLLAVCRIPLFRAGRRFMGRGIADGGTDGR